MKHFVLAVILCIALVSCITEPTPTVSPLPSPLETPAQNRLEKVDSSLKQEGTEMDYLQGFLNFCVNAGLQLILGMCVVDIALGVGSALKSKTFDWAKLGDFYLTQVLSLLVPYIAVLAVLEFVPGLTEYLPAAIAPAALLAGVTAKLLGSIAENVGALGLGK